MKTIKKNLTRLAATSAFFAVALSLVLTGCNKPEAKTDLQQDFVPPDNTQIEEPGAYQLSETIISVLDEIRDYRPGTLGSSLKIQIVSFAFIDFSQEDAASDLATFNSVAEEYIADLDDETLEFFKENVARVEQVGTQLFTQGLESLKPILNDAGNPQKHEEYDEEKYNSLMTALKNIVTHEK